MFSQLGPLFKTTFRQAESNDTRLKIPHDERDQNRKKQNEESKNPETEDLWQDNTDVSIHALETFLINFIQTLPEAENLDLQFNVIDDSDDINTRPHEPVRPTNTQNAKAVRAYQNTALHTHTAQKKSGNTNVSHPSIDQIQSKELREMYQLIQNLGKIKQRGVETIIIKKSGTFLESLIYSVQDLLGE